MKIKQIQNNPFQENTYVVWDEASMEAAIVDCGALFPQEEERIEAFVSDNNLKVKYILNTHLHLDHCFGNAWAAGRYGVLPMAHKDDETLLARMGEQARMFGLPFEVKTEKLGGYLKDGDVLTLGENRIEVIHTPGHSRGGLCFYIPSAGWLVSGDSLFEGSCCLEAARRPLWQDCDGEGGGCEQADRGVLLQDRTGRQAYPICGEFPG